MTEKQFITSPLSKIMTYHEYYHLAQQVDQHQAALPPSARLGVRDFFKANSLTNMLTKIILWYIQNVVKGQAERVNTTGISAIIGGRSWKIEVKTGRDKLSEDQKEYREKILQAGGVYIVARNFGDILLALRFYQYEGS